MSNNNQTAIDFLVEKLIELGYLHSKEYGQSPLVSKYIKEAKNLNESQHIDTYCNGMDKGQEIWFGEEKIKLDVNSLSYQIGLAEEYLRETFES